MLNYRAESYQNDWTPPKLDEKELLCFLDLEVAEEERFFQEACLDNPRCQFHHERMDALFEQYKKQYPQYHLRRYYTQDFRMLDHIYHCCRKNSAKEILYKAGLDELAVRSDDLDEIDLLSGSPSELYGGISMKLLRALNSAEGARLLESRRGRQFVKDLQRFFPKLFQNHLNDAQCRYLHKLMDDDLTAGEAGRLFLARKGSLQLVWNNAQYELFDLTEKGREDRRRIEGIDPVYREYFSRLGDENPLSASLGDLKYYLLLEREKYDRAVRRSNRKRDDDWQERTPEYVVRYPQTINDLCREAVYMHNCLLGYVTAFVENNTTILFMRKAENVNQPFITIEVFEGELMQAYHRFNVDCNEKEKKWILEYCARHGIGCSKFKFDRNRDLLF